jgi:hypothetical protein
MPMTMKERLDHARAALSAYFTEKGEPAREINADYADTDVSDLIADMLHLQKALRLRDSDQTIATALMHFEAEEEEEAHTVGSSYGTLSINSGGFVTRQEIDDPVDGKHLLSIEAFDLTEWHKYWRTEFPSHFDILDLGYWYAEKGERHYAPADATWRKDIAEDLLGREKAEQSAATASAEGK